MYRLITPLDGSQSAEAALTFSIRLAERFPATLELVHVIAATSSNEPASRESVTDAERYLSAVAAQVDGIVPCNIHVLHGDPIEELLRFFQRADDTIIVMSRHGRTALRRTRFGSVAISLMRGTNVPILLVDDAHPIGLRDLNQVLVPLDGSDLSTLALPYAVKAVGTLGRLCLTRIVYPPDERVTSTNTPPSRFRDLEHSHDVAAAAVDEAREFLLRTAKQLRRQGVNVNWEVRFGNPSSEIMRASETAGAQMIVMATHGWGGARHWTFGSVTDAVIQHGTIPVLVIPPARN